MWNVSCNAALPPSRSERQTEATTTPAYDYYGDDVEAETMDPEELLEIQAEQERQRLEALTNKAAVRDGTGEVTQTDCNTCCRGRWHHNSNGRGQGRGAEAGNGGRRLGTEAGNGGCWPGPESGNGGCWPQWPGAEGWERWLGTEAGG